MVTRIDTCLATPLTETSAINYSGDMARASHQSSSVEGSRTALRPASELSSYSFTEDNMENHCGNQPSIGPQLPAKIGLQPLAPVGMKPKRAKKKESHKPQLPNRAWEAP